MTLRSYQIHAIVLIAILLLMVPWVSFAFVGAIQEVLWAVVVMVFGTMAGIGGFILNYAVTEYVVGFGKNFADTGIGSTIDILWVMIRDIFNLTFIFGLVFIGFKMILGSDESGTRRWLINLIMAALLVNFSLFITKFIVDFTNIAASQITHAFPPNSDGVIDISGSFMNALGVQGILDNGQIEGKGDNAGWGYIFGALILFLVMAFVFAAGGIILLIRYAMLCLYMVMSPLMFIGWVFPQMQSLANQYWHGFIGKAFFAPVYLLLVFFSYKIVAAYYYGKALGGQTSSFAKIFAGGGKAVSSSFGATLPPFIISCIFLVASIIVASKLSADGATTAMNMGRSATNSIKRGTWRATKGTTKFAAAQTGGRVARRTSDFVGSRLDRQIGKMQTKGGVGGWVARTQLGEAARKSGTSLQGAKFGLGASLADDKKKTAAIGTAATKRQEAAENSTKRNAAAEEYKKANQKANDATLADADRAAAAKKREEHRAEVAQRTKNTTDEELITMDKEQLMEIAEHLSDKQIETLEKSGKFSTAGPGNDIQKLKDARGENTFKDYVADLDDATNSAERLGDAIKGMADTMKGLSDERLTGMKAEQLNDSRVAMHLSHDQLKTLKASGKYSATEISKIEKAREEGINKTITDGSVVDLSGNTQANDSDPAKKQAFDDFKKTQRQNLFKRSATDVALLPVTAFTHAESFNYVTPTMLEGRLKNGVTNPEKLKIEAALQDYLKTAAPTTVKQWTVWTERSNIGSGFDLSVSTPQTPTIDTSTTLRQAVDGRNQPSR